MFRRVLSSVVEATTGSMRKRLYVRLAAGGAVLATTIVAIALAQRSTSTKTAAVQQPPGSKRPAARSPQPITPSEEQSSLLDQQARQIVSPPDDDPGYATVQDGEGQLADNPYAASQYGGRQYSSDEPPAEDEQLAASYGGAATTYGDSEDSSPAYNPYGGASTRLQNPVAEDDAGYGNPAAGYAESPESGGGRAEMTLSDGGYAAEARAVAAEAEEDLESETDTQLQAEAGAAEAEDDRDGGEQDTVPATEEIAEQQQESDEPAEEEEFDETGSATIADDGTASEQPLDETSPTQPPTTLSAVPGGSRSSAPNSYSASPTPGARELDPAATSGSAPRGTVSGLSAVPPARLSTPPATAQPLAPGGAGRTADTYGQSQPRANPVASPLGASTLGTIAPTRPGVADSGSLSAVPGSVAIADASATADATSAMPGPSSLSGLQTPSLSVEKIAPAEVQVGRAARFDVRVRNVGQATAQDVMIVDRVPEGTSLSATQPEAQVAGDVLVWRVAALPPGGETLVTMEVVPQREGEIGSVAQVTFSAQATAQTVSTRPNVILEVAAAPQVLIGDSLALSIVLRNDGSGAAQGLFLEADVPEGLAHPAGRELENEIGTLRPGESRPLNLTLKAEQAGTTQGVIRVRDDGQLSLTKQVTVEIVAPQLTMDVKGPTLRYLQRQAVYELDVANAGTAAARNVELIAKLPVGMKFVSADNLGQYDASRHEVYWSMDELAAQQTAAVTLTTLPIEVGDGVLRVEGFADLADPQTVDHQVRVAAVSELAFSVSDTADPIEVGSETVYEVEVTNRGGKADSNVIVSALLPEELEAINAEGPTRGTAAGQQVEFEPVPQLGPNQRLLFRITAAGRAASDARIVIQVRSDDTPKPISKEESTRVYSD